jgi:2-alkyl-3-oxoalkanoate reductase
MKVFVTGGSGFLGHAIVLQLLDAGHEVHTFARNNDDRLNREGVTQFLGSLTSYSAIKEAMTGCHAVIHAAAKTGIQGTYDEFYDTNVLGTQHILEACRALNIQLLVYTSTASVIFDGGSEGKNEELPYPKKFDAYYPQTKAIAEQQVIQANGPELATVSLRPHLVWGPGDPHFFPRLMAKRRLDKLRILGKKTFRVDVTYVDDAAKAHLQALAVLQQEPNRVAGKAYFLSQDEPIAVDDFMNRLVACGGLGPVTKRINPSVARFAGWCIQKVYRTFRLKKEPPFDLFIAKQLSSSHWYDISAAKRDFGFLPELTIEEGMERLKKWYVANSDK